MSQTETGPRACTIAASLAVIGEKWSLLVIRELSLGVHRFDAIQRNTGAPRDILSSRLRRLESEGVIEKRLYQLHPPRHEYGLTEAGNELRPILLSLSKWGARWTDESSHARWLHECGAELDVTHTCAACGGEVTGLDLHRKRRSESAA
ncbi:MAG TPA: helix-turn-helix domain-containing protein [Gaiellaceae bacterium]